MSNKDNHKNRTDLLKIVQLVDSLVQAKHIVVTGRYCVPVMLTLRTDGKHLYNPMGASEPLQWVYDITDGKLLYGSLK